MEDVLEGVSVTVGVKEWGGGDGVRVGGGWETTIKWIFTRGRNAEVSQNKKEIVQGEGTFGWARKDNGIVTEGFTSRHRVSRQEETKTVRKVSVKKPRTDTNSP